MQAEDAEYLDRVLEEAKQRKAKLAAYVIESGAIDDYSHFQEEETISERSTVTAEMVPLDMVLSDILECAKSARASSREKKAKQSPELPSSSQTIETPPEEENPQASTRKMTKAISSNRGLTRCRKKTSGNARVSNRAKYDKKMKKLSGRRMVADAVQGHGGYEGESHGIAIHVNRSRKIT